MLTPTIRMPLHAFLAIALPLVLLLFCPASRGEEGQETMVPFPQGPNRQGKPQAPMQLTCWLPAGCKYVRGIVVAHPMIKDCATAPLFRKVAADESLGAVVFAPFAASGKETIERLDKVFDDWAKASGHPEIRGAAVFTAGLSASVLWARNVGYGAPDRVFGILHVAGGNLHQQLNDERKTLSGVPFIAMNGQFESCGPDGGIRPHLALETQWYLMGDTMLERRKQDPDNLMSLVVVPGKSHTAWNQALGALFLRKAAQYRLPKEKRDGSTPAKCVVLKAEDGWLTDRNVKHPKCEPAPYAQYKGDKSQAFWHFDKEMALAVGQYHLDGIRAGQERTLFRPAGLFEDLWPLGERMDIPFKGDTPAEYAAAVSAWIGKKTGGKLKAEVLRYMAESIAGGLLKDKDGKAVDEAVCHEVCQRVCYAYEDAYQPLEAAIEKTNLAAEAKDFLRTHYAEEMLVSWPRGRLIPELPVRAIAARVAAIPADTKLEALKTWLQDAGASRRAVESLYGAAPAARPANLDKLLEDLRSKDSKVGWAAVDEVAKLGASAIPELVGLMDYGAQPAQMRAAAALGLMGKAAVCALPDLRRNMQRGGTCEMDGVYSAKVLEAIAEIEKAAQPLELVQASFFGTAENDDLQGGAAAPDGTLYLAGNTGAPMANLPGGLAPVRFGADAANPKCGHGFVAHLSADGSKVLAYGEFAKGIVSLTTVQVSAQGVYVAGYATDALEPLLKAVPGLVREYPLRKEVKLVEEGKWVEAVGENTAKPDPIPEAKHAQLGRYGAPCVLRLSTDLCKVECGTYLEGWQQVWAKARCIATKPKSQTWPAEYSWQPTHLALLHSNDVLVCHDGGYFRLLTEEDRQFAAQNAERLVNENPNPAPAKPDQPVPDKATRLAAYRAEMARRLGFYDVCDHLSRLSPDLAKRIYRKPLYTPATDLETAKRIKSGWSYPHFSNPRTLGMWSDNEEKVYLWGWSASATSRESWWSPYIWKMDAAGGNLIRKIEEKDPMSGGDNRMGGAVADRAIGAVALDQGDLLYSSYSDGGLSGVIHFSGSIVRMDEKTKERKGSARTAPCFWAVDLAALPRNCVLALGRCNFTSQGTADAWQQAVTDENPEAWLRLYGPKFEVLFSTAMRGVVPFHVATLSDKRFLVVGESRGVLGKAKQQADKTYQVTDEPNPGVAVVKNALFDKQQGQSDGYFMIVEYRAGQ